MATFDEDVFLNTEVSDPSETKFTLAPPDDYTAYIDDTLVFREYEGQPVCDVRFILTDVDELAKRLNMDQLFVTHSLFIDVDKQGRLAFGVNKNVDLGRLREALGQNKSGKPWSFQLLKGGGPIKITVIQRPDRRNPDIMRNRVTRVVAA